MKFAKARLNEIERELEQDLVPEWRAKYLDYKTGKKKVKAVERALRIVNQTPKTPGRRRPSNLFSRNSVGFPAGSQSPLARGSTQSFDKRRGAGRNSLDPALESLRNAASTGKDSRPDTRSEEAHSPTKLMRTPPITTPERRPLRGPNDESRTTGDTGTGTSYGSIIPTPPAKPTAVGPPSLELPDPALDPSDDPFAHNHTLWRHGHHTLPRIAPIRRTASTAGDAYEVGRTHTPSKLSATLLPKHRNIFRPRRTVSTPGGAPSVNRPSLIKRMFTSADYRSPGIHDVPLEAYKEFDLRQAEFFTLLDKELNKIESFYKMKENESNERMHILREQLHEMRDRRLEEVIAAQKSKERARHEGEAAGLLANGDGHAANGSSHAYERSDISVMKWLKPIESAIGVKEPHFGKNTKALGRLGSPPGPQPEQLAQNHRAESRLDFIRRQNPQDAVPYRTAKRKLKLALQEFYRGLELLKSYALLNRTAFRKINKKYDKAVNARPTGRYMSERVNKAWFVQSEVLDGHIVAVEDLYARYFERGNHKLALGKLRSKPTRGGDYSGSVFRNGLLLAAGAVLGVQGVVHGAQHLSSPDATVAVETTYLLQIYAGYFLGLYLFLLFCVDCRIWSHAKINYTFIFEFDTRHVLDWRQLSELPCFFFFLEGLCLWLNFRQSRSDTMFLYWPVVLIGLTVLILFFPAPILYHRSRRWWAYSNWRLLLAGLYPVEFRDFFLGDMYCSQTYNMGNLELFFCLYARGWNDPNQCNSSHSRLLGFLSALPGIWRALQCLRRYYDTRNAFPHLVNCGKYMFTIMYFMSLSLYRIDEVIYLRALFIASATINSIYCSIWDLAMDWSLCNPYAKNPFLRDVLGYKRPWVYYVAMFLDPIFRFNWIFYMIYTEELQHSAILSFLVGFSEISRRGMWTLFRVENEHCTNVGRFRASRDVPLPYEVPSDSTSSLDAPSTQQHPPNDHNQQQIHADQNRPSEHTSRSHAASGADLERAATSDNASSTLRQRRTPQETTPVPRGIARVGTIMAQAHAQDFERKRKPDGVRDGIVGKDEVGEGGASSDEDDDEEGEDHETEQDVLDAAGLLKRHPSATE
ncbi:MAG: hypothetical protein M1830_000595 [Pleopsidium flavum]|nr:MAG: hypothetical protein M1830_000595 [Pleopsidium flavum]